MERTISAILSSSKKELSFQNLFMEQNDDFLLMAMAICHPYSYGLAKVVGTTNIIDNRVCLFDVLERIFTTHLPACT